MIGNARKSFLGTTSFAGSALAPKVSEAMLLKKTVPWLTSSSARYAKRLANFPSPALTILNFTNPNMLGMKEQPGKVIQEQVKRGGRRRTEVRVMTSPAIPQGPMFHLQGVPLVLQQDIMCFHIASMLFPIK